MSRCSGQCIDDAIGVAPLGHETPQSRSAQACVPRPPPKDEDPGQGGRTDAWAVRARGMNTRPGRWRDRKIAADHLVGRRGGRSRDSAPERRQRRRISQLIALKCLASTAQNAVQRRGCAVLRRGCAADLVSTCRLCRLSGSIRWGDGAVLLFNIGSESLVSRISTNRWILSYGKPR